MTDICTAQDMPHASSLILFTLYEPLARCRACVLPPCMSTAPGPALLPLRCVSCWLLMEACSVHWTWLENLFCVNGSNHLAKSIKLKISKHFFHPLKKQKQNRSTDQIVHVRVLLGTGWLPSCPAPAPLPSYSQKRTCARSRTIAAGVAPKS